MRRLVPLLVALAACADPPPAAAPKTAPPAPATADVVPATSPLLPVHPDDAILGDRQAPLTLMVFADYQCPYCRKAEPKVGALAEHYGEALRVVWKDLPLRFHKRARPAAVAARKVQRQKGDLAFFSFHARLMESELDESTLAGLLADVGVSNEPDPLAEALVDRGIADAAHAGIDGTPGFMLDGVRRVGLRGLDDAQTVFDAHKAKADALRAAGVAKADVYGKLVEEAFVPPPPEPEDPVSTDVWKVEVGRAPSRGPKDALVTVVTFGDFECPFCKKHEATLAALEAKFAGQVRLVFKHHPLPFHPNALPTAVFLAQIQDKGGDAAFFAARDAVFKGGDLSEEALVAVADKLGLAGKQLMAAAKAHDLEGRVEDDLEQAEDLGVRGTPCTFVNGRRLDGARKLAVFEKVVAEELAKAKAKVAAGAAAEKLYEATIAGGKTKGPFPLAVPVTAPSRGPKDAKVVLQVFTDFECPFCRRLSVLDPAVEGSGALVDIEKAYGKKVRVVFRNYPLSFHKHARRLASFAFEVGKQKGPAGFFAAHDALFAAQPVKDDEALGAVAKKLGVDWKKVVVALDAGAWDGVIDDDVAAAEQAGVEAAPSVWINGHWVVGAQPFAVFRRKIDRALAKAGP